MNTEFDDSLVIGYDYMGGIDKTILLVGRRENDELHVINQFEDEKAERLHKILTGEVYFE